MSPTRIDSPRPAVPPRDLFAWQQAVDAEVRAHVAATALPNKWTAPQQQAHAVRLARDGTIAERFERFHKKHPEVYQRCRRYALEALHAGHQRIGMRMIWERLRWSLTVEERPAKEGGYALNDHFPPHYARLLEAQEPELVGFFEKRKLRA